MAGDELALRWRWLRDDSAGGMGSAMVARRRQTRRAFHLAACRVFDNAGAQTTALNVWQFLAHDIIFSHQQR